MTAYKYLVKTEWLNINDIKKLFQERGNWQESSNAIDFFYRDGSFVYNKQFYHTKSQLANTRDNSGIGIANKMNLYDLFYKYNPQLCKKFMAEQYHINNKNYLQFNLKNKIWILKPVKGFSGSGISIISDRGDLEVAMKNTKYQDFVIAEYINNPLLYKNRKFHIRLHVLLHKGTFYFDSNSEMLTAAKEYYKGQYDNKLIHDTHAKSTIPNLFFNTTAKGYYPKHAISYVYNQIIELCYYIKNIDTYSCYPESKDCYEVYGADVLITDTFQIKLLEVNDKIALDKGVQFKNYFRGILESVVDKSFPPKNFIPIKSHYFVDPYIYSNLLVNLENVAGNTKKTYYMQTPNDSISKALQDKGYLPFNKETDVAIGFLYRTKITSELNNYKVLVGNTVPKDYGITNPFHLFQLVKFYDVEVYDLFMMKHYFVSNRACIRLTEEEFGDYEWELQLFGSDNVKFLGYSEYVQYMDSFKKPARVYKQGVLVRKEKYTKSITVPLVVYNGRIDYEPDADYEDIDKIIALLHKFIIDKKYMRALFDCNYNEGDYGVDNYYCVYDVEFIVTENKQLKLVGVFYKDYDSRLFERVIKLLLI